MLEVLQKHQGQGAAVWIGVAPEKFAEAFPAGELQLWGKNTHFQAGLTAGRWGKSLVLMRRCRHRAGWGSSWAPPCPSLG